MLNAIGLFNGILTIVGFSAGGSPQSRPGISVQIRAGYAPIGNDVNDLGGRIQSIWAFDGSNSLIGQSDGGKLDEGAYDAFTIGQDNPAKLAEYISLGNSDDGTCISWIKVSQVDNSPGNVWTGDVGAECGQRWYMGGQSAGRLPNGDTYMPRCTWFDSDFTDGTLSAGMKFRVRAYGAEAEETVSNDRQCNSTIFSRTTAPIPGEPAKRSVDVPRPQWILDRLVVSNITGEDAELLCSSKTSWGPDFVGADGKFCDMESKQLSQLCEVANVDGCVELDSAGQSLTKRTSVARREVKAVHKQYQHITYNSV
ncbi:hypothetical protein CB0940_11364 [Cercospora beticola]|uniref:Uncharacterized protein n=1 Tax=Cercospora beticola TaxID=122368 RepID=A0A2G5HCT8_CERBT|nr:hypothetical protein CB0940_11364 [Cercospora beticola]PIA90338.1 hypothetical protein CB0940_11364 [Cercospora beticola]WPB08207.1 hypothetical protein RHO25_012872 [Cercospora beticola]CAK1367923.1 unnamed protein product [Cercospora beticola]